MKKLYLFLMALCISIYAGATVYTFDLTIEEPENVTVAWCSSSNINNAIETYDVLRA